MDYSSFQPGGQNYFQVTPPQIKMPYKNFTPKFIGVILILVALGVGASYGIWWWGNQNSQVTMPSATPDPTAGWKTYTNVQYGFQLKYPPDWSVEVSPDGKSIALVSAETEMALEENNKELSDPKLIKNCITEGPVSEIVFSNHSTLALDIQQYHPQVIEKNYNGIIFKVHPIFGMIDGTTYETEKDNKNYVFDVYDPARIDQILSTFKFTNSVDTSTWKTYTNTKYGYSIQYPETWEWDVKADQSNGDLRYHSLGSYDPNLNYVNIMEGNYSSGGNRILAPKKDANLSDPLANALLFQVIKPDPVITVDQFLNQEMSFLYPSSKKEALVINGLEAERVTAQYIKGGVTHSMGATFIKDYKNRLIYLFQQYFDVSNEANNIVSTFKLEAK